MKKKILFVVKSLYTVERYGVMLLSALAKGMGWESDLLILEGKKWEKWREKIEKFSPEIIACSVMTTEFDSVMEFIKRVKEKFGLFTIMGGPHPTFFPEFFEKFKDFLDVIFVGESEISFPEFLKEYENEKNFKSINGIWFKDESGKIIKNPPAPLVEDLDSLPFADRELMVKGDPLLKNSSFHFFFASRGCPNKCTYCFNHKFNQLFKNCGNLYRRRSPENLISEMKYVREKFGMNFAYIDDDIFTMCSNKWLEEFSSLYKNEVGVPFICNTHVNFIDEEKIKILKDAGCKVVCFGIECGDEKIRREILKRNITDSKILETGKLLRKYGIKFITQNILLLPTNEPLRTDFKTLDLNIKCKPDFAISQLFYPLPKTELTEYAIKNGFFDPKTAKMPERTNSFSALQFPNKREKKKSERLHKLFGVSVNFPFLRPFLPFLISLPLGWFYSVIYILYFGIYFKFKIEGEKKGFKEIVFYLKSFVNSLSTFIKIPFKKKETNT